MIMICRVLSAAIISAGLGGCAIHPLPEQVAGVDTPHIVRQIRCEARDAVKTTLLDFLEFIAKGLFAGLPAGVRDPVADRLVALYTENPDLMDTFNSSYFPGPKYVRERAAIDLLLRAGAAYTFDFNIFEDNDITTNVNLLRNVVPTFSAAIEGSAKRRRSNERTFTVTDTFGFLLAKLNAAEVRGIRYCDGQIVGPNYVYPIAGRVGVDRTVKDFARLLLFENLGGKDAKPGAGGAPTMTDDLIFTTAVTLSGTPKVVFAPVGTALSVADASLGLSVGRSDKHQVTIGLAVDVAGVDSVRGFLFSAGRGSGGAMLAGGRSTARQSVWAGQRVTGGGTPSEILAVIAIDQQKSKEFRLQVQP